MNLLHNLIGKRNQSKAAKQMELRDVPTVMLRGTAGNTADDDGNSRIFSKEMIGVTIVDRSALANYSDAVELILPNSVKKICTGAFRDCHSLKSICLAENLRCVKSDPIAGCKTLERIDVSSIKAWLAIEFDSSYNLLHSENVELYVGGKLLTHADIPAGTTRLGIAAFANCRSLKSVHIPRGVREAGTSVFSDCPCLERIEFDRIEDLTSIRFQSNNGFLGTNHAKLYIGGRLLEEAHIPEGTESLFGVLSFCTHLRRVNLPKSLRYLSARTFAGCTALETINIPSLQMLERFEGKALYDLVRRGVKILIGGMLLETVNIPKGMNSLKPYMFGGWSWLKSIRLHDDMAAMASDALIGCTGLAFIDVDSLAAWQRVRFPQNRLILDGKQASLRIAGQVTDCIRVPEGTIRIEPRCYHHFLGVREVYLPASLKVIGRNAFTGCASLEQVHFAEGSQLEHIEPGAFRMCSALKHIELPDGITVVGDFAFADCDQLSEVNLPRQLDRIGRLAFAGCSALQEMIFPENLRAIGELAFADCRSLRQITCSSRGGSIGKQAFRGCMSLEAIHTVPNAHDVRRGRKGDVGAAAFRGAISLRLAELPEGIRRIDRQAFCGCSALEELRLPAQLLEIGNEAFLQCEKLRSLSLPPALNHIGEGAFAECTSLTVLRLDVPVRQVRRGTFSRCRSLEKVWLGEAVSEIENGAFAWCRNLTEVIMEAHEKQISISPDAFAACRGVKITWLKAGMLQNVSN